MDGSGWSLAQEERGFVAMEATFGGRGGAFLRHLPGNCFGEARHEPPTDRRAPGANRSGRARLEDLMR